MKLWKTIYHIYTHSQTKQSTTLAVPITLFQFSIQCDLMNQMLRHYHDTLKMILWLVDGAIVSCALFFISCLAMTTFRPSTLCTNKSQTLCFSTKMPHFPRAILIEFLLCLCFFFGSSRSPFYGQF